MMNQHASNLTDFAWERGHLWDEERVVHVQRAAKCLDSKVRVLAAVLARANQCPPAQLELREAFYAIKDLILRTWGTRKGCIVQRTTQECWGDYYEGCHENCAKCGGDGIYSQRFYKLEEWEICGHIMHRPVASLRRYKGPVRMEGKKNYHSGKAHIRACWVALFMIFDPYRAFDSMRFQQSIGPRFFQSVMRICGSIGPMPSHLVKVHDNDTDDNEVAF